MFTVARERPSRPRCAGARHRWFPALLERPSRPGRAARTHGNRWTCQLLNAFIMLACHSVSPAAARRAPANAPAKPVAAHDAARPTTPQIVRAASGAVQIENATPHVVRSVEVAPGVSLEVLDWGGSETPIVLLAGLGNSAHIFDDLASAFVDRWRVVGVSRRGFGRSTATETGYDVHALGADVLRVLDALAALDAERGLSRSNAVTHAAHTAAADFAPRTGMGVFDVFADEHGVVRSVSVVGAPADGAKWQRVGRELHHLLIGRRLRVPPGAKGLAARLRIETGDLAKDVADRFRSERSSALGQAPAHPREIRDESTRDSLEPGHLSPTLGATLAGGSRPNIRVVLLDERPL